MKRREDIKGKGEKRKRGEEKGEGKKERGREGGGRRKRGRSTVFVRSLNLASLSRFLLLYSRAWCCGRSYGRGGYEAQRIASSVGVVLGWAGRAQFDGDDSVMIVIRLREE